jgi:hypothetical protein
MAPTTTVPTQPGAPQISTEGVEHPVGTLAIVGVYGLLFAIGWLLVYFFLYLPRGPVTP